MVYVRVNFTGVVMFACCSVLRAAAALGFPYLLKNELMWPVRPVGTIE